MIIHTSLTYGQVYDCRPREVDFERFFEKGSRSRPRAFNVLLSGTSGRRANFGNDWEAATWDEWGVFLGAVFALDPEARAQHYLNAEHFHWCTGHRFETHLAVEDRHRTHRWGAALPCVTGSYSVRECPCGAVNRWVNFGHSWMELAS